MAAVTICSDGKVEKKRHRGNGCFYEKISDDSVLSLLKDPPPKVVLLPPRSSCGSEFWWTHLWLSGRREVELVWVWLGLERFVGVQSLSHVGLFATPWTAADQAPQSFTISRRLLKLMSVESLLSNHLMLYCPLLLPSVFPSIRFFPNESALSISWLKYWRFSISPSNEYSGFFPLGFIDLLPVQGTLRSLLRQHSSKALILRSTSVHDYWKNHSFD